MNKPKNSLRKGFWHEKSESGLRFLKYFSWRELQCKLVVALNPAKKSDGLLQKQLQWVITIKIVLRREHVASFGDHQNPLFSFFLVFLGTCPWNPMQSHVFNVWLDNQFFRLHLTIIATVNATCIFPVTIHFDVKKTNDLTRNFVPIKRETLHCF